MMVMVKTVVTASSKKKRSIKLFLGLFFYFMPWKEKNWQGGDGGRKMSRNKKIEKIKLVLFITSLEQFYAF